MKTKIILCGLLFITKWSAAQDQPLPIPQNGVWQMAFLQSMVELQYGTYAFRINGEQSINDTLYHVVEQFNYCHEEDPAFPQFLIRENEGKWYRRTNAEDADRLYFDFTLDTGETVTIYSPNDSGEIEEFALIVESVDELEMYDGTFRRVIHLNHTDPNYEFYQESWVEGIGHYYNGIDKATSTFMTDSGADLRCFLENDERVFPNENFGNGLDCCIITSIDEMEKTLVNLYPSPASSFLNITSRFIIHEIVFFDVLGQKVYEVSPRSENFQMDISNFSTGYYICRIFDQNGTQYSQKILLE